MPTRLAKIALVASIGVLLLLVALDNVLDYGTNFDVVQHILAMDKMPPSPLQWRAITSPTLHHLSYWVIIATEFLSALLSLYGAWLLWGQRAAEVRVFNGAKQMAVAGLAIGLLLYLFGFMAIGEWFQMWRAGDYNMEQPAFRFIGSIALVMLFLAQPDVE